MNKNEPIIYQICNDEDEKYRFRIPYEKGLCKSERCVSLDIKINTDWYENVLPDVINGLNVKLDGMRNYTVLIKPHGDEYFAGWARWFHWDGFLGRDWLRIVISDSDWGHLESETKIGDNFRARQFSHCHNLRSAANEDLDGKFEKIGRNFRARQYAHCCLLEAKPLETMPCVSYPTIKNTGSNFRAEQFINGCKERWSCKNWLNFNCCLRRSNNSI